MKIFLCKGSFAGPVSGADQMIVNYALHLKAAGHDPHVIITVPFARDNQYLLRLSAAGIPVKSLGRRLYYRSQLALRQVALRTPWFAKYRDWEAAAFRTAVDLLRKQRPDVLHVIAEGGLFIQAAYAAGIPVIHQEPAMPYYGDAPEVQVSYAKLSESLPLASELVAVSPRIAQLCRERLNCPEHVSVVPILVDDLAPEILKVKVAGPVTFGFAARIEALKGPMVLLEAFARIVVAFPAARLIIAGSGDQEVEIKRRAQALSVTERVEFPGNYVDEAGKLAFLDSLDVLVHPSLFEGTPCTVIEAMAYRLPVIASQVGGVPDMVTSKTGILVPPNDVDALATALSTLAGDESLRLELGRAARERYEEIFSPSAVLPMLVEKYQRAIARENPNASFDDLSDDVIRHPWADLKA
ncbi:MAG: glycosyltransferase [Pyrinomonadaceae bacterium]